MVTDKQHLKIAWTIIQSVFILMVYMFIGFQFSTNNFLHYNSMLPSPLSIFTFYLPIVSTREMRVRFVSRSNWCFFGVSCGISGKPERTAISWIVPVANSSAVLRTIRSFLVNTYKFNRERFITSLAAAKKNAAFIAGESFHVSILHQVGKTCQA